MAWNVELGQWVCLPVPNIWGYFGTFFWSWGCIGGGGSDHRIKPIKWPIKGLNCTPHSNISYKLSRRAVIHSRAKAHRNAIVLCSWTSLGRKIPPKHCLWQIAHIRFNLALKDRTYFVSEGLRELWRTPTQRESEQVWRIALDPRYG